MGRLGEHPPLALARGEGPWLYDRDGRRFLDGISSWWVNLFGHAHPAINAAIADQLTQLPHAMLAGCTHEPVVELSERLSALTGHVLGHCFYASDGASAVEIALKMSVHYWRNCGRPQKHKFVYLKGGYHGETVGALAVTDVGLFRTPYERLLKPGFQVNPPDLRRMTGAVSAQALTRTALDELASLLEAHSGAIAAVIAEPLVQCAGGMVMHPAEYIAGVRKLCTEHAVHLIADEIAVGCGRTGTFFASEQTGEWPDFLCLSKGISGGYLPLSLVMSRTEIFRAFYHQDIHRGFLHSHTYTGNPLACRAALAVLDLFEKSDVLTNNRDLAHRLDRALAPLREHPAIANYRRCGMIWAFDVIEPSSKDKTGFAERFHRAALSEELLLRPIGTTIYLMPPYILAGEHIEHLARGTKAALDTALNG
jgi:adenosylmethionine---8-amino-7-oxononanoate aminotransferase